MNDLMGCLVIVFFAVVLLFFFHYRYFCRRWRTTHNYSSHHHSSCLPDSLQAKPTKTSTGQMDRRDDFWYRKNRIELKNNGENLLSDIRPQEVLSIMDANIAFGRSWPTWISIHGTMA